MINFKPKMIFIAAGHGGDNTSNNNFDPGAVHGGHRESDQVIKMTDWIVSDLENAGLPVKKVPHNLNLGPTIDWINREYKQYGKWDEVHVLEVHRNSANIGGGERADLECGVYYYQGDARSKSIGDSIRDNMVEAGAYVRSWLWDHGPKSWRPFHLGFLHKTEPMSHLLELGFMQGRNDEAHLQKLAKIASTSLIKFYKNLGINAQEDVKIDNELDQSFYITQLENQLKALKNEVVVHKENAEREREFNQKLQSKNNNMLLELNALNESKKELENENEVLRSKLSNPNSSDKNFYESKKFIITMLTIIIMLITYAVEEYFNITGAVESVNNIIVLVAGYLGVQGVIDVTDIMNQDKSLPGKVKNIVDKVVK